MPTGIDAGTGQAMAGDALLGLRLEEAQCQHRGEALRLRPEHAHRPALLDLGDAQAVLGRIEAGEALQLVVDVGGAQHLTGQALKQPQLLVSALRGSDHPDGAGTEPLLDVA